VPDLRKSDVRVVFNEAEFARLKRGAWVRQLLRDTARPVQRAAQARAPRRTGNLIANIRLREGESAEGPHIDITTEARAPDGFRYGAYWQRRRPYLRAGTNLTKG
jgi:hypothetical protein